MNKKIIILNILLISMFLLTSFSRNKEYFIRKDFSKSGNYYYEVTEDNKNYYISIFSKDNSCVFTDKTGYRTFDRFYICWDENYDKLWIWSSDIGLFTIEKNDVWIRQSAGEDVPPSKMIENVPYFFSIYTYS